MRLIALLTALLAIAGEATATAHHDKARVGHTVERIGVEGSAPGPDERQVDVHLWYPADKRGFSHRPPTVYSSALRGLPLLPERWDPLSWKVAAEVAREDARIDRRGKRLPVIVFSHGNTNDPIDYAHTLELIAAEGFVVAAPYHINNTQDDVRIDFVNAQAGPPQLLPCRDGRPGPCSRTNVPFSMADRVRDISAILDELPDWFGHRVDPEHAGVLGHSRGTVTALAAAGGSGTWPVVADSRVKAIMGLAIGARGLTLAAGLANVTVPTVLVAGGRDINTPPAISEEAFGLISNADKLFVEITNATHRSFDSTYCAQLQSAGANAKGNPRAVLDLHTATLVAASAPGGISGKAVQYCAERYFRNIEELVASIPNSEFPPVIGATCVTTSIPCTGPDTEEVKEGVTDIATEFFDQALDRDGRIRFRRHLDPDWLLRHVPMVGRAYTG
jgi:predicted dienelactone hydrolase